MSKIGNRALLRALGRVLGIEDVTQSPSELDVSSVKAVVGLDPGMFGMEQIQLVGQANIGNTSAWDWQLIGSDGSLSSPSALGTGGAVWRTNQEHNAVILSMRIDVVYPAASGDNLGRHLLMWTYRQAANNTVSVIKGDTFWPVALVNNLETRYPWSYPMWQYTSYGTIETPAVNAPPSIMGASPIFVPAGSRFGVHMDYFNTTRSGFDVWPVGTVVDVTAFIVTCPKGMRPPGM